MAEVVLRVHLFVGGCYRHSNISGSSHSVSVPTQTERGKLRLMFPYFLNI